MLLIVTKLHHKNIEHNINIQIFIILYTYAICQYVILYFNTVYSFILF